MALDSNKPRSAFPSLIELEQERSRALVFHFLANHELLALELMALLLLRFDEAPAEFRQGIAFTMTEEQKHLRLYLERMADLGLEFGEVGVNDFFWKTLSTVKNPEQFVAGMSLTFEQCNLDFSKVYLEQFGQLGDVKSKELMQVVYDEEIGHVAHGLKWLIRWSRGEELWKSYLHHLPQTLSPARAKGSSFDREARLRAGLPTDFIDKLESFAFSKGKSPDLYWFNPTCEFEQNPHFQCPKKLDEISADLEAALFTLGSADDVLICRRPPSEEHLLYLRRLHLARGQVIDVREMSGELNERKLRRFRPWGWSPLAYRFIAPWVGQMAHPPASAAESPLELYAKSAQIPLLTEGDDDLALIAPQRYRWPEEREALIERLEREKRDSTLANSHWFFKPDQSTSGRGHQRWQTADLLCPSFVEKHTAQGTLEPWVDKCFDFSLLYRKNEQGKWKFKGFSQFFTDDLGAWQGSLLGRPDQGLSPSLLQFLHHKAPGHKFTRWQRLAEHFLNKISEWPTREAEAMGIDFMGVSLGENCWAFYPCEVNPRFTFGHVALELSKKLRPQQTGRLTLEKPEKYRSLWDEGPSNRLRLNGGFYGPGLLFLNAPNEVKYKGLLVEIDSTGVKSTLKKG